MKTPVLASLSPFARILFVVILVIVCVTVFLVAGMLLAGPLFHAGLLQQLDMLTEYDNPDAVKLMKYFQVIQSVGLFIVPPLVAAFLFDRNVPGFLGLDRGSSFRLYLLVLVILFVSLPFLNWTASLNEALRLPSFLHGIEQWMVDTEKEAAKLTDAFLVMNTWGSFAFGMLLIAVLPAIGEELFFRGMIQRLLGDWLRNIHVAIVLASFVFALFHLQFYGFLPRFVLGLILGYLYFWSGSLWLPVFAHFINNGSAVLLSFLAGRGFISVKVEEFGTSDSVILIIGSAVLTGLLVWMAWFMARKTAAKIPDE
jgi:membrane protease YdiL (CAAX protease family)